MFTYILWLSIRVQECYYNIVSLKEIIGDVHLRLNCIDIAHALGLSIRIQECYYYILSLKEIIWDVQLRFNSIDVYLHSWVINQNIGMLLQYFKFKGNHLRCTLEIEQYRCCQHTWVISQSIGMLLQYSKFKGNHLRCTFEIQQY